MSYVIHLSAFGDPFPSHVGANFGYHWLPYLKVRAGMSVPVSSIFSMGVGGYLLIPNWKISPTFGLNLSKLFSNDDDMVKLNGTWIYATMGVDWQTPAKLNIGLGFNLILAKTLTSLSSVLPYLQVGFYFDS